jgi:hypothetical protein
MQWVKIQITDKTDDARALLEMSRRGRIDCYPDQVYMVPEPALLLLKEMKVKYTELGRGGLDDAEKTLRDTLASRGQQRKANKRRKVLTDS